MNWNSPRRVAQEESTGKIPLPQLIALLAHDNKAAEDCLFMRAKRSIRSGLTILFVVAAVCPLSADMGFDGALRWRNIGPFRGGRTHAVAGVPSQPNVFYMAQVNGGVF